MHQHMTDKKAHFAQSNTAKSVPLNVFQTVHTTQ